MFKGGGGVNGVGADVGAGDGAVCGLGAGVEDAGGVTSGLHSGSFSVGVGSAIQGIHSSSPFGSSDGAGEGHGEGEGHREGGGQGDGVSIAVNGVSSAGAGLSALLSDAATIATIKMPTMTTTEQAMIIKSLLFFILDRLLIFSISVISS
jgi:hypothetical protein